MDYNWAEKSQILQYVKLTDLKAFKRELSGQLYNGYYV